MHMQITEIEKQLSKLQTIDLRANEQAQLLRDTLARECEVLSNTDFTREEDELITGKFRTKVGKVCVQLERILLDIDGVDTLGGVEEIRAPRKQMVNKLHRLLEEADVMLKKANALVAAQDAAEKRLAAQAEAELEQEEEQTQEVVAPEEQEETTAAEEQEEEEEEEQEETAAADEQEEERVATPAAAAADEQEEERVATPAAAAADEQEEEGSDVEMKEEQPQAAAEEEETPKEQPPQIEIGENRFAYTLDVTAPFASQAKVVLSKQGQLSITLPGRRTSQQFSIGNDVDMSRATVRPNGLHRLRLVLPKQITRSNSNNYYRQNPWRQREDFWASLY